MTPLDTALTEARGDVQKGEQFYNLFLNTMLFVPLTELPKEDNPRQISPILIEYEGTKYLMLFDEEQRLVNWAKRQVAYAQVPGYALLEMMDPEILFVLNAGTEPMHQFVADELAWLRAAIKPPTENP